MKNFKRILLPYDKSSISDQALKVAEALAKTYQAKITLLYVHDKSEGTGIWKALSGNESAPFLSSQTNVDVAPLPHPPIEEAHQSQTGDEVERNIENEVFATAKGLLSEEVPAEYKIIEGEVVKEIIQFTHDHKIDLIIMGSDGQEGFRRQAVDQLTNKVANETNCSIFIVK